MLIKKISDELVYLKRCDTSVIEVNGKRVRIESYHLEDVEMGNYDGDDSFNEEDMEKLTEDERELLEDNLRTALDLKEGEETILE